MDGVREAGAVPFHPGKFCKPTARAGRMRSRAEVSAFADELSAVRDLDDQNPKQNQKQNEGEQVCSACIISCIHIQRLWDGVEWCVGVRFRAHGNSKLGDKGEMGWSWDGKRWRGLFVLLLRVVTEVYRYEERLILDVFI